MLTCRQVADYFLALFNNDEAGELISNLKLQKLVYYAQAHCLGKHGVPLFDADIEAWANGFVVPELYQAFRHHGANAIPPPSDFDYSIYSEKAQKMLDYVYVNYGQYSAWRLSQMVYDDPLWKEYKMVILEDHVKDNFLRIVPKDKIKNHFRKQIRESRPNKRGTI